MPSLSFLLSFSNASGFTQITHRYIIVMDDERNKRSRFRGESDKSVSVCNVGAMAHREIFRRMLPSSTNLVDSVIYAAVSPRLLNKDLNLHSPTTCSACRSVEDRRADSHEPDRRAMHRLRTKSTCGSTREFVVHTVNFSATGNSTSCETSVIQKFQR